MFKREPQKSKCLCSGSPRRHILGCGISSPPPPRVPTSFSHILCNKYENTLTCKRISWNSGDVVLKRYFLFPIFITQKVTTLAPK